MHTRTSRALVRAPTRALSPTAAASGEKDNGGVIREIVALRQEKAALLGCVYRTRPRVSLARTTEASGPVRPERARWWLGSAMDMPAPHAKT